jgi:hypothetical protein
MLPPDAEARFRRIEDELTLAAELLTRFERRSGDRFGTVEAIRAAMDHWLEEISGKINILTDRPDRIPPGDGRTPPNGRPS